MRNVAPYLLLLAALGLLGWWLLLDQRELPEPQASIPDGPTTATSAPLRMLVVGDPFALALQSARESFEKDLGHGLAIEVVGYNDVREMLLQSAADAASPYDLVSFDVVWMGEYADKGLLLPLTALLERRPEIDPEDFLAVGYRGSAAGGVQYGLPIQPHCELLWYRKDLLQAAGLEPPRTTDQLLTVAAALHRPEEGVHGICWNAQRGQPLGQTMAHLYAAFGQPLLDEKGQPTLDTPKGIAAARFARDLMKYSPPDILEVAWDERTSRYAAGQAALTYGWAARAYLAETDPRSVVSGKTGYAAAPHAPGVDPVTPAGTWSLGIPANVDPKRQALAERALALLTSPAGLKRLARHGSGGMPRLSVIRDPDLSRLYPAFPVVRRISEQDALQDWMRPAVPQWATLAETLGTVFHDMLQGKLTPEAAVAKAQREAERLFAPPTGSATGSATESVAAPATTSAIASKEPPQP